MMNEVENHTQFALQSARFVGRLASIALIIMLLSACASNAVVSEQVKSDDDIVVERAKARWAALLSKDLERAYSYYSPGYRSTTSVVDFMFKQRTRRVKWESSEYLDHSCSERACNIRFKTGFKIEKAVPGMNVYRGYDNIEETWVKPDDEWWYVPPKS